MTDWFYLPSWRPTLAPAPAADWAEGRGRLWLVFDDGRGVCEKVAEGLRAEERQVAVVRPADAYARVGRWEFEVGERRQDYERVIRQAVAEAGTEGVAGVVHLWGVSENGGVEGGGLDAAGEREGFGRAQRAGYYSLLRVAQGLAGEGVAAGGAEVVAVTGGMQELGEGAGRAEWATVLGVSRVAGQEMGGVRWVSVDVEEGGGAEWAAGVAERVLCEVRGGVREGEVAWRGWRRWVRSYEQVQSETASDPRAPLRGGGVYLITGGLEGVGFEVAKHLAEKAGAKLVLVEDVSSESLPSAGTASASDGDETPKHARHVSLLESLGAEVSVAEADVADEGQMRSVVARAVERFGVIHGVIHAAGVSGERTFRAVVETGEAESAWQFRPKVYGTYVLAKIFKGRNVDFLVLASSLSSVLGGRGLTAYCAASRFLDALAQAAGHTGGPPLLSVNFDAWETAGESEGAKPLINSRVTHLSMTNAEGAEAFHRALSMREARQVLISTTDLRRRAAEQERAIHPSKSVRKDTSADGPPEAGGGGDAAPARGLEEIVTAAWRKGLGVREIGLDDNFFDLGGDSLIAIQVISQLKKELGVDIPVVSLYEGLTVRYLVGLLRKLTDEGPAGATDSVTTGQLEERASRRRAHIERQRTRRTPIHQ